MPAVPTERASPYSVDEREVSGKRKPGPILLGISSAGLVLIMLSLSAPFLWPSFRTGSELSGTPIYLAPVTADSCDNPKIGPDVQSLVYRALLSVPQLKIEVGQVAFDRGHRMLALVNCAGDDLRLVIEFHRAGSHIVCWIESYEAIYPSDLELLRVRVADDFGSQMARLLRSSRNSCV